MKAKEKSRYERLSESVKGLFTSVESSTVADDLELSVTFNSMEIAKFTGLPKEEALTKKIEADKNPMVAQGLRDDYGVWKEEQNNNIAVLEARIMKIIQAEKDRLLSDHGLKTESELKTNKASNSVSSRWNTLDLIQKNVKRRIEQKQTEKMVAYKDCKTYIGNYLLKELSRNNDLDKFQNEYCTKALIKLANLFWMCIIVPGLFKKCSKNGSYFFSSTGKSYEAVEAAYYETLKDETKRCCC